jgi:hypothetical protein
MSVACRQRAIAGDERVMSVQFPISNYGGVLHTMSDANKQQATRDKRQERQAQDPRCRS